MTTATPCAVIILAAGNIRTALGMIRPRSECVALTPVGTKPLAAHIIDFYKTYNIPCFLVINQTDQNAVEKELKFYRDDFQIVPVSGTANPNESLAKAISQIENIEKAIVNLATSIPTELPKENQCFINETEAITTLWSTIELGPEPIFHSHKDEADQVRGNAFTGVFATSFEILKRASHKAAGQADLINLVKEVNILSPLTFRKCEWIDCGHDVNYFKARKQLVASRSFNSITIDGAKGIITKSSSNAEKLKREIGYISMLPENVALYFPRVLGPVHDDSSSASVSMEYYGYPTLAEYMIFWNLDRTHWNRIFSNIKNILSDFKSFPYQLGRQAHDEFYISKIESRLASFRDQLPNDLRFIIDNEFLVINGKKERNYVALKDHIHQEIRKMYRPTDFAIMHGDLCFNNMLYDIYSGTIRLIDARGAFSEKCIGIYGDVKYDLAKVAHSTIGGYDFIVSNLYSLSLREGCIEYSIGFRENHQDLCAEMNALIIQMCQEKSEIMILTALLFITMCPLHNDCLDRQIAFYSHGISLLNKYLGNEDENLH